MKNLENWSPLTPTKDYSNTLGYLLGYQQHQECFNVAWRMYFRGAQVYQYIETIYILVTGSTVDNHLQNLLTIIIGNSWS